MNQCVRAPRNWKRVPGRESGAGYGTHPVVREPAVRAVELDQLPASNSRRSTEAVVRPYERPAPLRKVEDRLGPIEGKRNELEAMHGGLNVTAASR